MSSYHKEQDVIFFELYSTSGVTIKRFEHQNDMFGEPEYIYQVAWSDFVANEWEEYFDTLSDALLRVGVLAYCHEKDGVAYADNEKVFASKASVFKHQTTNQEINTVDEVFDYEKMNTIRRQEGNLDGILRPVN
jgi:hypothetical protein